MCFFKVSVSGRVTGLMKGYWLCAGNREPPHWKKKEKEREAAFVSSSSGEVSALAGDQTKGAVNGSTFTLMLAGGASKT